MPYEAFISYSHQPDRHRAQRLQSALEKFARPVLPFWLLGLLFPTRFPGASGVRICCDRTDLATAPGLWSAIQAKLADSQYLILLASPAAATSPWVAREVTGWLEGHAGSTSRVLIVLTAGEIVWGGTDFDWTRTTALPRVLEGRCAEEPRYEDLRNLTDGELTLRNADFQDVVANLAAQISGRSKRELIGEELQQQRNRRRTAGAVAVAMSGLAAVAFYQAQQASYQAQQARDQRQLATDRAVEVDQKNVELASANTRLEKSLADEQIATRQAIRQGLAAQAEQTLSLQPARLPESLLTAIESIQTDRDASSLEAYQTLQRGLSVLPEELRRVTLTIDPRLLGLDATGTHLVVVGGTGPRAADQRVSVFRADTLALVAGTTPRLPVNDAQISPDGTHVAVGGGGSVEVLAIDARSKQLRVVRSEGLRPDNVVAVSPAGRYVASTGYGSLVRVYGENRGMASEHTLPGTRSLTFSADDRFVLAGAPPSIGVLPVAGGRSSTCRIPDATRVAFGSGGRFAATALVGDVTQVWRIDFEAGLLANPAREPCTHVAILPHQGRLTALAVSSDGRFVGTSSLDSTARIWDVGLGREIARATHSQPVHGVAMAPDGSRFLTVGADRTLRLWRPRASRLDARHLAAVDSVRLTSDDELVTTAANGARRVWRVSASQLVEQTDRMVAASLGSGDEAFRYLASAQSRDGRFAAVLIDSGSLYVWRLGSEEEVEREVETADVVALAVSNGGSVATGDEAGQVRRYAASSERSARPARLQASGAISALAFSDDGRQLAVGTSTGDLRVWSSGGRPGVRLDLGAPVSALVFDRDGSGLAVATPPGVRLIDAMTGAESGRLPAPAAVTLALSRDGQTVATGDRVGVIRLWRRASQQPIAEITHSAGVRSLAFSADGTRIAAGSDDQLATVWAWQRDDLIREACVRLRATHGQTAAYGRACPGTRSP